MFNSKTRYEASLVSMFPVVDGPKPMSSASPEARIKNVDGDLW